MKKALIGIVVAIVLFLGGSFAFPSTLSMERSMVMKCSAADVYANVADLRNWEKWLPWKEKDPAMKITFGASTTGPGASYTWKGPESGEGSIKITAVKPNKSVKYDNHFIDFDSRAKGYVDIKVLEPGQVEVRWGFNGEPTSNPIMRYMNRMMIKPALAEDFDRGLELMKKNCAAAK